MQDITCIILTKDEALHIERCIRSAQKICRKVLVVDSFSNDETCTIAESLGAKVVQHKFTNQAAQFNWAIDNMDIDTEWIWRVDADEIIEDGLAEIADRELPKLPKSVNGIYVNKKIVFMNRPLLHGGWYPAQQIKIVRKGFGRSEDKLMDEHLVVTEGETVSWNGDQTDWNLKPLDWWWEKHEGYAMREARMQVEGIMELRNYGSTELRDYGSLERKGKLFGNNAEFKRWMKNLYSKCPLYVRPIIYFIGRYIFMGGFLDGYAGWYWHTRQGLKYRMLVDKNIAKLRKESIKG